MMIQRAKLTFLFVTSFLLSSYSFAKIEHNDVNLVQGKLANGMNYLIYPHANPPGEVNLWLQIHAGSLQEEDNQRGLAHFVEHMLFNGSRDYPGNDAIKQLEKMGLKFGPDVNAVTNQTDTIYMINMRLNNEKELKIVMNIFYNWAALATFDANEIEAERGVIIEEWRDRQNLNWRLANHRRPYLLANSRYLEREPMGDMDIIRTASKEQIEAFYHHWYQPENMTFIVVGDVNTMEFSKLIEDTFSSLKNHSTIKTNNYVVPEVKQRQFLVIQDKENSRTQFSITYRIPMIMVKSFADYIQYSQQQLLLALFSQRMQNLLERGLVNVQNISVNSSFSGESLHNIIFSAEAKDGDILLAMEALLQELARIDRYGFTTEEIQRQKEVSLHEKEMIMDNAAYRNSKLIAPLIAYSSRTNSLFLSPHNQYELTKQAYDTITAEQLKEMWQQLRASPDQIIEQLISVNGKPALSTAEIESLFKAMQDRQLEPYQPSFSQNVLITNEINSGKILSQRQIGNKLSELQLSNGSKVVLLPTATADNNIHLIAFSHKGALNLSDNDYYQASLALASMELSGLGPLSSQALAQWQAEQKTNIKIQLQNNMTRVTVAMSKNNPEPGFQLLYQQFQPNKIKPEMWERVKNAQINQLKAQKIQAEKQFEQMIHEMTFDDRRMQPIPYELLEQTNIAKLEQLGHQLLSPVNDFTFIIVGSFKEEEITPLIAKYIASLSNDKGEMLNSTYRQRTKRNNSEKRILYAGDHKYAKVAIYYYLPIKQLMTEQDRLALAAFNFMLNRDLREILRERESGLYRIESKAIINPKDQEFNNEITFNSAPEQYESLLKLAHQVRVNRVKKGVTEAELNEFSKILLKQQEIRQTNNLNMLNLLVNSYYLYQNASLFTEEESFINQLNTDKVNTIGQQFFSDGNGVEIVGILLPEQLKP